MTKSYGGRLVLRGIELQVRRGERVAVLGPNGAGKSTLIKALGGIIRPTSGSVWVEGVELNNRSPMVRKKIGVVGHSTFLYGHLTVSENLDFYGRLYDVADRAARIGHVLKLVQMEDWQDVRVERLSRGMQQRVSIARALLHRPSILLLDEPETGLEDGLGQALLAALTCGADERTVLLATHRAELADKYCERFLIMLKGRVAADVSRAEVRGNSLKEWYQSVAGVVA